MSCTVNSSAKRSHVATVALTVRLTSAENLTHRVLLSKEMISERHLLSQFQAEIKQNLVLTI